ncbi:MAG: hypothetical protein RL219_1207, partial [Actinomycetota bacterium]
MGRTAIGLASALMLVACSSGESGSSSSTIAAGTSSSQQTATTSAAVAPTSSSATTTAISTTTTTPLPVDDRWFWLTTDVTDVVHSLDPSGVTHELGRIGTAATNPTLDFVRLGPDSALVIKGGDDKASMWIARRDSMEPIRISPRLAARESTVRLDPLVVARDDNHIVLSLVHYQASKTEPARGELLWIDINTMEIVEVEKQAYRPDFYGTARYFGLTPDGLRLRYSVATKSETQVRELTIGTGKTTTLGATIRFGYQVRIERFGELFYFYDPGELHGPGGAVVPLKPPPNRGGVLPFADGKVALIPAACSVDCSVTVKDPFGDDPDILFPVDAAIDAFSTDLGLLRLLPDGSLLMTGMSRSNTDPKSPYAARDPDVSEYLVPLLRVSPGGGTEILGYLEPDYNIIGYTEDEDHVPLLSPDGRSMDVYEISTGLRFLEMPRSPTDNGHLAFVISDANGMAYGVSTQTSDTTYAFELRARWSRSGAELSRRFDGVRFVQCSALGVTDGKILCSIPAADGTSRVGWLSSTGVLQEVLPGGL